MNPGTGCPSKLKLPVPTKKTNVLFSSIFLGITNVAANASRDIVALSALTTLLSTGFIGGSWPSKKKSKTVGGTISPFESLVTFALSASIAKSM